MTREEFAKKWGHERTMNTMGLPVTIPKYDEFLKDLDSLSLPPAEGAEEILKKYMSRMPAVYVKYVPEGEILRWELILAAMNEFATLHAQKIADKMVEWISVEDKLPEEHEDVLCYNGHRISSHNWCKYTDQDDDWFKETFTHWRKLPEIPKP